MAANIIFCFSGTGNSLAVARDIASQLGDTEVVLLADALRAPHIDLPYERVGFAFPVYYSSMPPIIGRLVDKMTFRPDQYVFAAVTAGIMFGNSFDTLARLIAARGGKLNAAFPVRLPGNFIAMYSAWPASIQRYMLQKANQQTEQISQSIKDKRPNRSQKDAAWLAKPPLTARPSGYSGYAKDYRVTDACNGCQTCARICPMHNITMDGKPQYGDNCERCMACIQWCPVQAIVYKNVTVRRKRYRHPEIKAADLFPKP